MKKIISLILSLILVFSLLTTFISAENGDLTEDEARQLIYDAFELYDNVHDADAIVWGEKEEYIIVDGKIYHPIDPSKLYGGSYEGLCAAAEKIFLPELAPAVYSNSSWDPNIKFFHFEGDRIYTFSDATEFYPFFSFYNYAIGKHEIKFANKLSVNGDKATVKIIMYADYMIDSFKTLPVTITCEFAKTADGWRISGGEFYKALTDINSVECELYIPLATDDFFSVENGELTEAAAKRLIHKAFVLFDNVHDAKAREVSNKRELIKVDEYWYLLINPSKLIGGSYEGMCAAAEKIFLPEIAPDVYSNSCLPGNVKFFHFEGDRIYMGSDATEYYPYYTFIHRNDPWTPEYDIKFANKLSVNGDKATVKVIMYANYAINSMDTLPVTVTCEFAKTADGWRISGGEFYKALTDVHSVKSEPYSAPATGDADVSRTVIFSAAALLALSALIPTAYFSTKRRKCAD